MQSWSEAPDKRLQHINTTYPNIIGLIFVSSGQTIATFPNNISQHYWAYHAARVWPSCRHVLRHVGCWKSNYCACPGATMLHERGQTTIRSCNIHKCCMKNLTSFEFEPTTNSNSVLNLSQHVVTPHESRQHVAPNNVAICCVEMLQSIEAFSPSWQRAWDRGWMEFLR